MKLVHCIIAFVLVGGCHALSPTPSPDQMAGADFGAEPHDLAEILREHLADTLIDPDSVKQFAVSEPTKCGKKRGMGTPVYGWCATYEYNAKNRMGGYSGKTSHDVMVFNGDIIFENGFFVE